MRMPPCSRPNGFQFRSVDRSQMLSVNTSTPGSLTSQQGFTLVELLVVVSIMLIMTGLVVGIYTTATNSDRIRSAARQMQSAMMGAHDRAIHAKQARGIRLNIDGSDPNHPYVTSMAYIQPVPRQFYGHGTPYYVAFCPATSAATNLTMLRGNNVDWLKLVSLGLLNVGSRVRIPAHTGQWYTISSVVGTPAVGATSSSPSVAPTSGITQTDIYLTAPLKQTLGQGVGQPYPSGATVGYDSTNARGTVELELANQVMPNQAPLQLPTGIAIDLNNSSIPWIWTTSGGSPYSNQMDIMFSPLGNVTGPAAAQGLIIFLLRDIKDIMNNITPAVITNASDPTKVPGEQLAVTVYPQTGAVITSPLNPDPTDIVNNVTLASGADGRPDNMFSFAKKGALAGR